MIKKKDIDWQDKVIIGSVLAGGLVIAAILFQPQFFVSISQNTPSSASSRTAINSDPLDTIVRYYNLAPKNRREAIKLLSDSWRRRNSGKGNDRWWNSVRKVEVYAFQTFAKNNSKAKIKVWLKYYMKNGATPCESLIVDFIFDRRKNKWLMDGIERDSVIQKPSCDRT